MGLNHVYKVIWSKTKHCYVVVSELAKRVGRNKVKAAVVQTGTVAAVLAVTALTGSVAQAALNDQGTGSGAAVAWGTGSQATTTDSVAIGKGAKAENANAIAIGGASKSSGDSGIALGNQANAENKYTVAIGRESKASGDRNIALGYQATANKNFAIAIGAGASAQQYNNAVAIGANSQANGATSLALGMESKTTGHDSYAIGYRSETIGEQSIAFGRESKARKKYDIVFGSEANTRDQGQGHSIAIGVGAMSGTNSAGKNLNGGDAGGVAIGTGAYTGVNRTNISLNSSVAVGAGAGAGYRKVDTDGLPTDNATDADNNATVLVKAFGGTTGNLAYFKNAGNANKEGFFSFQNVNINEATALGRNARAIGDQSVAIGAQSVAGQGSIVIGGNDIQSYDSKKYFKAANPTKGAATTVNDYDAETTPGTDKNGNPITITNKYKELVGDKLDNTYRSSYGQDGSTVIGMQAHSTTPLGVAIGTNSIVRKGAFGATAIGSGASVFANAEAAVAIGMGSQAQGNYAVAAGTAAKAKESAVAAGYSANAEVKAVALGNESKSKESAVAVGDSSEATNSSVAVGQSAKAQNVADIAVGQGAVASGEQGAIAMGLGTKAQGDSSIMIGGSEITKVAAQTVNYQKEKKDTSGNTVIKTTKKQEHIGGETVERTIRSVEMENATGSIQDAYGELTNGATLTTTRLDYSLASNKNGHGSISMGIHSLSTGDLGTAIGTGARVTKLGGVALGTGAISELQNGVAIGTGSRADADSIGTRQTDISYDKEGHIVPFDSKKVAYTFYWAGGTNTSEGDVVSFGTPGAERQLKNVAAGRIADDSTDAINGSQLNSVTKRMSSGWSVEGEKDHNSSGVLKLKGTVATGQSVNYAADGKSSTKGETGTATGQIDKVRLNDEVKMRVGDNLVLNQEDASRPVYEDPDNKDRQTGTRITSKFTYSLNPVLKNLTSATFKNDAGDTTVINGAGVTVTPVTTGKQPVSLTTSGLNNGGNAISNVASNLPDTKNNTATKGASNATKSQEAPTLGLGTNEVNPTNAATVSDVLNAGWNLQGNGNAVDFVKPYDTVNFVKGDGTSVSVESTDGKTSTVKYSVNLGDGLEKDKDNKITVKAADKSVTVGADGIKVNPGDKSLKTTADGLTVNTADKSLEVTNNGLKVKTDGKTITTDNTDGLKVVTGEIEPVKTGADPGTNTGTVKVKDNDAGKIATVDSVVSAVNSAAWTATSGSAGTGTVTGTTAELIKAGNTVTFKAGDNLAIKQAGKEFIYSLNPALSGLTSAEFKDSKNNTVNITPTGITITKPADTTTNTPAKTVKLNQDGLDNGGNTITNVKSGLDTYGGNVPGTTDKNTGLVNLSKPTAGEPKVSDNTAATVGDIRNMGWIVSSNKTTGADGAVTTAEYSATVKNANEVKFVGEGSAIVSGKTDGDVRTITVKVDDQTSTNNAVTPVVYTDENGNRVYPTGKKDDDGNQIFNTKPDGSGNQVTGPVKTTVNGPKGTSTPTTLSNVEGNLVGAKTGTDAPTTSATAPTLGTGTDQVNKNNVATVGDVLQAGWNLQNNDAAKDFVKPYDTVNFVDGEGTTAVVETTTDKTTSKIKYNVNTGNGLQKDTTGNTISVKPADKSLAVGTDGVKVNPGDKSLETTTAGLTVKKADSSLETTTNGLKVKTDGTTITTDGTNGLKVVTGDIEPVTSGTKTGTVKVKDNDAGKIATVDTVAKAVNNAAFTLKASATTGGTRNADSGVDADGESIKAGSTVEMIAGKNLDVKHDTNGKITFATVENPSFNTIQVGGSEGPKFSKTADGNISVSDKDGTEPVKITNVKDGDISKTSKDAINGSQFHAVAKNTIKLAGQNGTAAATETDGQSLDKTGGIKFTVKSSDGTLLDVTAAGDTITLTPKTATLTTTDGVPTATTTGGKLVTADQLVTALTEMGWKATAGQDDNGTVTDATVELIKAGDTVTFKAGNNLAIKQDGKNFIYSLQKELTGLTSAEFKDADNNTVNITPTGITITKPADATGANGKTVTLNQDGLNNGGNAISNVASNLPNTQNSTTANTVTDPSNATKSQEAPTLGTGTNQVNPTNAATVSDVLNAGWNLQGNGTDVDFVKPYDTVNFVNGDGTTATVESTDGKTSTVKYSVNLGNGLQKDTTGNTISVKSSDKSLTVGADGVKVNPGDESLETTTAGLTVKKADSSLETTTDGLKVKTDGTTITTDGTNGLKVVTGTINNVTTGDTAGTVEAKTGDGDKIATVGNVVSAINNAAWTATSAKTSSGELGATAKNQLVKAGDKVTFEADKNIKITQTGSKFTFTTKDNVSFSTVQVGGDQGPKLSKTSDGDLKVSGPNGTDPVKVTNVKSGLDTYGGNVPGTTAKNTGLVDLSKPTKGEPKVSDNTAATVGDIRNMGWVVSSNKTTGANGAVTTDEYSDTVKNANEVKFVGEGSAIVSGKTEGNVRTITVKVDNQTGLNKTVTPVNYTKADGTKVYPQEVDNGDGTKTVKFFENPDGSGAEIPANQVITSVNGPEGTTTPTTLSNVKANLPDTKNSTTANTEADPSNATKSQVAPTLGTGANEINKNNAATVGDVLNAGWNLQGNGVAKDFVKPYDTVNFVNGDGTTATVESADGKTSTVKYSVNLGNGLEKDANNKIAVKAVDGSISSTAGGISVNVDGTTIGKANDGTLQAITGAINEGTNGDLGKVVSNTGDGNKLATVNTVVNAINNAAWTANSGAEGTGTATGSSPELIKAGDIVVYKAGNNLAITQAGKNFTYSLKETLTGLTSAEFKDANKNTVNITPTGITITKPADTTTNTPEKNVKLNQDGLDNGGNAITNVKSNLPETQNSNKANTVADPSNATKTQAAPNTTNATGTNYINPNNAATVGDVLNAGWNLQGNGTAVDFVKPYDTVNFVNGLNTTAVVSTVDGVTSNVTYNVTGLPITYTDKDGNPVSKIGDNFYKVNDKGQPLDANGNPSTKVNNDGKPVDDAGNVINPIDTTNNPVKTSLVNPSPEAGKTGTSSPTTLDNVTSKLENYNDPTVDGKTPVRNSLVDLSKPTDGSTPKVSDNTVATVGDLRNMGWIVSSDKNTDDLTKDYSDIVKNANEVKFVGEGTAIVSGKTDGNVRTITVKVDDQTSTNNAVTPVVYTDKDGNRVYPTGKKAPDGNEIFNTQPDGKGNTVTGPVKTTVNGPNGTNTPTSLSNVKNNIPTVNDEDKTAHNADGTVIGGKNNTEAPITSGDAANLLKPTVNGAANPNFVGNNAATVSDVLNAGWNLQNNGTAKDFVKPYDTVNFINGLNTTAVVTTSDDGTTSNVTYNVTGLPVTYTTADGTPVTKIGDKYYKVNDQGQPVDGTGAPVTKFNKDGKPVDATGQEVPDVNIANNPLKTSLVNPTPETGKTGTSSPTTLDNVTSKLINYDDPTVDGKTPVRNSLVDLSKPTDGSTPKVSDNTVATVGDIRNMGWIVSSDKTTGDLTKAYSDTVKNANEVKFVGEGTAVVSGKTDGNIRTITVKVDDQTSTNNAVTPVNYTKKDGTKVYPKEITNADGSKTVKFYPNPDGTGTEVPDSEVITSVNGPKGTKTPTTLSNVEGNLDGAKTNTTAPTTEATAPNTNNVAGSNYVNPHNAATVGDVLSAGWNLQGNGVAKDFVKPYDTVNFVNGINTTAVVTTSDDGTTSNVTYNVTGLPVTYTTADGTPVSKIGDKYYKVNDQGQPVDANGNPVTKFNQDGAPVDAAGQPIPEVDITTNPLTTSVVNPKADTGKTGTTTPTTLSNVEGNLAGAKTNTIAPTTNAGAPNTTNAAGPNYVNTHNAATVGDVLQSGWNLQGNGTATDFVKPYDTVNFVNGGNTTAVVTTNAEGTASNVTFNVTGLPVATTINTNNGPVHLTKVGDNYYPVKGDGTPDIQRGADGHPTNGYVKANDGNYYPAGDVTYTTDPATNVTTITPNANATPAKFGNTLTNPNVSNTDAAPNNSVSSPTSLGNVKNNLDSVNDGTEVITKPDGTVVNKKPNKENITKGSITAEEAAKLANPKLADGSTNPNYVGNNAATVSDVLNAGFNVQGNGKAVDFVKPYDTVNFRDGGNTTVSVTTDDNLTTHVQVNVTGLPVSNTITDPATGKQVPVVKVGDAFYRANPDGTPNIVRDAAGNPTNGYVQANDGKVYPRTDVDITNNLDGTTTVVPKAGKTPTTVNTNVVNPNVANTDTNPGNTVNTPTTVGNVEGNLEGAKTGTTAPTTSATAPNTTDATQPNYVNTHNAATVGDVLQAGWNLQNNGVAKDFVKPYDTVNFVNGGNTTAMVTTNAEGTASNVTFNVTGLPMTYTTADGTPVSKIGDKYYKVNEKGQPVDANGKPSTKVNANGQPLDENGTVIQPIDTATNPLHSTLVNPNVSNSDAEPNKQTTSPTQLGNVTSGLHKYGDTVDGKPVEGTTPGNTGLIDLSKPATGNPKVSDNTAATVGDLRNMGWIVSSDKTTNDDGTASGTNYTDQVRNANEVKFVGKGTAIVSGKTVNGVRTITVKVDDQVSTNNAIMPTSFTTKDGKKVYPVKDDAGNVTYHTTPDGKGAGDTTIDPSNVVTSVNGPGPNGTTTPTTLQNVKSNLPNVDDKKQKAFNPDGTEVTETGTTTNTGNAKAPLSHTVVAEMMSPYMMNAEGNFLDADGNVTTDPTKYVRNPNFAANNAATVGDVLQAGWNLQNNGESRDFVKPYDTVNFINGRGTTAVVTTREGNTTSDVTFNVKPANGSVTVDEDGVKVTTGEITTNTNGSVAGPTDPATAKQLKATLDAAVKELATAKDALKAAEKALEANPTDAALLKDVADKKADVAAKQTPVNDAQKAHDDAGLNKIATVQNVAEAINNAGFNLKTSEADGGKKLTTGTKNDGELIKPGNTVEMVAGNNLTVKQDTDGKITYATKDDVTFKTVDTGTLNVGSPNTFTDGKGNTYTKVGNDYYNPSDVENGAPKTGATAVTIPADAVMKPVSPVTMKAEAAKPATNNGTDAQPSSALNITSKDGKPTQITGVGSTLNTKSVDTTPSGTTPGATPNTTAVNLVDLEGTTNAPVNKNAAATVGDLQNMGWVVSAKDGNGYKDVVKNANVVDFKGGKGIEITGNTLADGTREITVGIKEGEVTNKVTITHGDGTKTDAVKIGDNYYKVDKDGKPIGFDKDENGKPAGTPLTIDPTKDKVTNNGAGFVTGNTVANAIQDSGWNIGKANISDVKKSDGTAVDFNKEAKVYDTVNPNDDVKFVDGANANVSMVTVDALNKDGTKKATTFVKVDVNRDLKIDSLTTGGTVVDKNGNNLVKVGDDYYKESDIDPVTKQPKANAKPVPPAKDGKDLVKVGDKYYEAGDVTVVTNPDGSTTATPKANAKPVSPAKDGEMIVKNADGKDVVSATVGKDGSGVFGVNGKDGKDGVSITAKDGEGAIGVNGKDGKNTSITGDSISIKDKDNKNSTEIGINNVTLKDKDGNTSTRTADKSELIDKDGNTNTSTSTTITLEDKDKNTNTSTATGTTYTDKDKNTTTVGAKEIVLRDKDGNNTSKLTNNDLLLNTKDPNTGVEKTSHMSGDKISFTTTDEIEKDSKGNPVIDPKTNQPKIKNPGNSTEYTNEGLKVIPNSTVARDANGNPTFLDKTGKPVMKDTDGKYKYVGQDGKPGKEYTGGSGSLKPNVVDTTRVISFGMDKPVLDANGNPVKGPDGKTVMTEGISAGMQQIHNVAPGTKDTDAVNVSQLKGMANVVMNVNNRVNRVGAQAAALAGLQSLQYDPLEPTQISAGLGYYKGAGALALGVNHFKNESTMFHMGASFNGRGDETMMNASVTWKFGARADETAVKDTFRQGPISASYTLQDKVSALEAQNQIQKDQLNELRATNAAQKAENEAQREELALMKAQIAELFKRMNG